MIKDQYIKELEKYVKKLEKLVDYALWMLKRNNYLNWIFVIMYLILGIVLGLSIGLLGVCS